MGLCHVQKYLIMKKRPKRFKTYTPFFKKKRRFKKSRRDWDDPRYIEWRQAVFARDNYRCVVCGKGGRLEAHHIYSYSDNPSLRYAVRNGATTCCNVYKNRRVVKMGCHTRFHKMYGKGGNNISQWLAFKAKYGKRET